MEWTARIHTPPDIVAMLRRLFETARPALRDVLRIQVDADDVRFALPRIVVVAERPTDGRAPESAQAMKSPPFTSSDTPFTYEASSEARKAITAACSSGDDNASTA